MKLLLLSTWAPYPADIGPRQRAYNLLRELNGRGYEITLMSLSQPETDTQRADGALRSLCSGGIKLFPVRSFPSPPRASVLDLFAPRPRSITAQPQISAAIAKAVDIRMHDAVVALQIGVAHYVPEQTQMPAVLDDVDVSSYAVVPRAHADALARLKQKLVLMPFRRHIRSLTGRYRVWTAVSEDERSLILDCVGPSAPPMMIAPNAVDLVHYSYELNPLRDPNKLVFTGSVSVPGNLDAVRYFADNILPLIRSIRADARLHVTGGNDVLTASDRLRREPSIVWTGHVQDVRRVIREAGVCVVPMRSRGTARQMVLEAMALGTPVVSTPAGVEGLAVRDRENVLVAGTSEEFAAAVMRLVSSHGLRERISRSARSLVEKEYGWASVAAVVDEAIHRAVNGVPHGDGKEAGT